MGNSLSPADKVSEREIERCATGSCTSIRPVIGNSHNANNSKYNKRGDVTVSGVQLWKNGIVPYELKHCLDYNKHRILKAMRTIEQYSRIRFVERSNQYTYLHITKLDGCSFRQGPGKGQQLLSLGIECQDFGTVLHELMHAIGFPHEQSRPDRDDYIIIHWKNIMPGWREQFWRLKKNEYLWSEFPFDYNSIMMYDEYAASKNGLKTHEAKNGKKLNRKTNLSEIDKEKLRSL